MDLTQCFPLLYNTPQPIQLFSERLSSYDNGTGSIMRCVCSIHAPLVAQSDGSKNFGRRRCSIFKITTKRIATNVHMLPEPPTQQHLILQLLQAKTKKPAWQRGPKPPNSPRFTESQKLHMCSRTYAPAPCAASRGTAGCGSCPPAHCHMANTIPSIDSPGRLFTHVPLSPFISTSIQLPQSRIDPPLQFSSPQT